MQLSEILKYEYANTSTLIGIKMQSFPFPALLPSNSCSLKMTISLLKPIKMQKIAQLGKRVMQYLHMQHDCSLMV